MKLFLGYMTAFASMTVFCFVLLGAFAMLVPLLAAFLTWSTIPLEFTLSGTMFVVRLLLFVSTVVGVCFICSVDGQLMARSFLKEKNDG